MFRKLFGAALLLAPAFFAQAATFNVSTPAEFQAALTAAQANGENDVINVAAGNYNVTLSGTLTYTAVATENASLTIDGTDSTFVTLDGGGGGIPLLRIDTTAVVDDGLVEITVSGMTFQNGTAAGPFTDGGALAILTDTTPLPAAGQIRIEAAEFFNNSADGNGGAIYFEGISIPGVLLNDLTIDGNSATAGGGAYLRGGLFNTTLAVVNVDFWNNSAAADGGGLTAIGFDTGTPSEDRTSAVNIIDVLFYNNQSGVDGLGSGGGADVSALNFTMDGSGFVDNFAGSGGSGGGLRVRGSFDAITMTNNGFTGNSAGGNGGGMAAGPSMPITVDITNNTVYLNSAGDSGGGLFFGIDGSSNFANFYNNILHSNTSTANGDDDLYVNNQVFNDLGTVVNVFNNLVTQFEVVPGPAVSGGNITGQVPIFVGMEVRPIPDPRLATGSPGIDQGDNDAPAVPAIDFEGDNRPLDGDGDTVAVVDIGMDEFSGAPAQNIDLSIGKTDDPDPVIEGANITYTISISNSGPGDASAVVLTDTLPAAVSFVSVAAGQGSCSHESGIVTCLLGTLASGASTTATVVVSTPDVVEPTTLINTATVSADEQDSNLANNAISIGTTVVPVGPAQADLVLAKSVTPDPAYSGGPSFTYSLDLSNNGPDAATGITVTDALPDGLTFESVTIGTGSCSETGGVVTCGIASLASGASTSIAIVVVPDVVAEPTTVVNTATVTAEEEDPVPGNNASTATSTVDPPSADLGVTATSTPTEVMVNEQITYDIGVSNAGPSDDTGVVLTVSLPAAADFVSASIDQGTCTPKLDTLFCTIGDMAAGASVAAQIVVNAPGQATVLALSASVSGDVDDPVISDNSASVDTAVIDVIDLVIEGNSEGNGGGISWLEIAMLLAVVAAVALRRARLPGTAVIAVALVIGTVVGIAPREAQAEEGWYAGAAGGQSSLDYSASQLSTDLANLGWTIEGPTVDESGTAWKVYGGFMFSDRFGLEAGYADLGKVTTRFGATIAPSDIGALLADTLSVHPYQGSGWIAAAVARWPFSQDQFALTAKAGLFAWESDTDVRVVTGGAGSVAGDDSGSDVMYAIGLEWRASDRWYLTASWERYKLNEWLDAPMLGFRVSF